MDTPAKRLMEFFQGQDRAYGFYDLSKTKATEGKKHKGKARTIQEAVTLNLWEDHVAGGNALGIIPIRDNSKCFFGAIDIDIYTGLKIEKIYHVIHEEHLPLIPIRSKSGGIHCYIFFSEPVSAPLLVEKLQAFASLLGHGTAEIFPKQTEVLSERGDMGNWINMPYHGGDKSNRYAYYRTSAGNIRKGTMKDFFEMAEKLRMTEADLKAFTVQLLPDMSDGPPCLQHMASKGIPVGKRNDALFNMGVYLKKAHPDGWQMLLDDFNKKYMKDTRLLPQEVAQIVKSLDRQEEWGYGCDKSPCKDHCNKDLCKTRQWGIGELMELIELKSLTKFDSDPPIWFADVEGGGRLELSTEDLQNQGRFQRRCMEGINQMPAMRKPKDWQAYIRELLEVVTVIEAPSDASPKGMLYEFLERFCTNKRGAKSMDELLMGRPLTQKGRHFFRLSDFTEFLERNKFRDFKLHKISSIIRDNGGQAHTLKIRGKSLNVWSIPEFAVADSAFDTPEMKTEEHF